MTRPTPECALVAPLLTAREAELSPEERGRIDAHLPGCAICRGLAADLAATEGLVEEALLAEAAKRDFSPLVDAVMERVGRETARRSWLESLARWARAHRAVAAATAVAPTVAALALIVYLASAGAPYPRAGEVEVVAERTVPVVLRTTEGPVVLLGDPEPGT